MNTLVFFFTLIAVIEVLVISGTALILRKSDNFVLAIMGEVVIFVFVWLIASVQVDDQDSQAFGLMAFYNVIALILTVAGLYFIHERQKRQAHH